MSQEETDEELHAYGDPGIVSADAPVPWWLKLTYISLPILGILAFFFFWNGAGGWFDRGFWYELEKAANTTFKVYP